MAGFVYILTNKNNTVLYTGVTRDLKKRVWEHRSDFVEGFTRKYRVHKLVYYETFDDIEFAIQREKYIKGKRRNFKLQLIKSFNPDYHDLYETI